MIPNRAKHHLIYTYLYIFNIYDIHTYIQYIEFLFLKVIALSAHKVTIAQLMEQWNPSHV